MRLIDADALKADYMHGTTTTNTPVILFVSMEQINNAPTINAVSVVCCKDCVHFRRFAEKEFESATDGYCCYNDSPMYYEDYCSDGERRSE
jgi:hypothetical protein